MQEVFKVGFIMIYGDNLVETLKANKSFVFHNERYHYSYNIDEKSLSKNLEGLKEFILFSLSNKMEIRINGTLHSLSMNEYLYIKNIQNIEIKGSFESLLCGSRLEDSTIKQVRKESLNTTKVVSKPWGKEYWLKGEGGYFSFKYILLNAGYQTSLQYHVKKEETNFIYKGIAQFYYKKNEKVNNEDVTYKDIESTEISSCSFIHVKPPAIHRLKAIQTLHLFEASTPDLDDVIRIEDDNKRKSGKIDNEHIPPPLCILTAGEGLRLLPITKTINKSLIPINGKPPISHILERIDHNQEVVVALGHNGALVKEYLTNFYPEYKIIYIDVKNYNNINSGPGPSLLACREVLQRPFYFVACDTLWDENLALLPTDYDWVGVSRKFNENKEIYCNFLLSNNTVTKIFNKCSVNEDTVAFVGLSFIRNFSEFWNSLEDSVNNNCIEVYHGYTELINKRKLSAVEIEWNDVGNFENIIKYTMSDYDFSKPEEFIWFDRKKVIKKFKNRKILLNKYRRALALNDLIPRGIMKTENYLYYQYVEGETFYNSYSGKIFRKFLIKLEGELWKENKVPESELDKSLNDFYITKTIERISMFQEKYLHWKPSKINNNEFYQFEEKLLSRIKASMHKNAKATNFHGDLQFDNILKSNDEILLIDWRESFGGQSEWGDMMYDLAKLYGGLIINYSLIKRNRFNYVEKEYGEIETANESEDWQVEAIEIIENYFREIDVDIQYIKNLTSLIFLNMSPLHHYPFDKFLYCMSFEVFNENR